MDRLKLVVLLSILQVLLGTGLCSMRYSYYCAGYPEDLEVDQDFIRKGVAVCTGAYSVCFILWRVVSHPGNRSQIKVIHSGCASFAKAEIKSMIGLQQNRCVEEQPNMVMIRNNFKRCFCNGDMCNTVDKIVSVYNFTNRSTPKPAECTTHKGLTTAEQLLQNAETQAPGVSTNTTKTVVLWCAFVVLVALLGLLALFSRKYRRKPFAPCVEEDQQPANESSAELLSNLELGVVISQGRHGKMWKGSFNSKDVAVKIYTLEYRSLWQNEKNIHAAGLSHPNVLKFLASVERLLDDSPEYLTLAEYHPQGCLMTFLQHNIVTWMEMCLLLHSATAGLAFLHQMDNEGTKEAFVHRDICSRNILLRSNKSCVIAGFGLAKQVSGPGSVAQEDVSVLCTEVGTLRYLAPEVLDGHIDVHNLQESLARIDVYAMALVMWEVGWRCVLGGETVGEHSLPFERELGFVDCKKLYTFVLKEKKRPQFPETWQNTSLPGLQLLKDSIEECWDEDEESRLDARCLQERMEELLTHPDDATVSTEADPSRKELPPGSVTRCSSSSFSSTLRRSLSQDISYPERSARLAERTV